MKRDTLKYAVDENPPAHVTLILALTHVLLIFDGILFIPNVLGKTTGIDSETLHFITFATILTSALSTFLQSRTRFGIGAGFILFSGSYSAFLLCTQDAVRLGGLPLMATMALLTVPIIFLYTFFLRFFRHIITPAVGGVVILLVAVSLVRIGLELWTGDQGLGLEENAARLGVGGATIVILSLCMLLGNTTLRLWSPILAMTCGYASAILTGQASFEHSAAAPWVGLPSFSAWPGLELHLSQVHIPLLLAFIMAMMASAIENTGNIMLVQQISARDFRRIAYDKVQSGLYCDGLSKIMAALLGTAAPSTYCDNLPLVEMTGTASRRIGMYGAGILLALAFMPKISGLVLDMPGPVIGGFLIVMAALLFHAGVGMVSMTRLNNQHGLILGLSLAVGLIAGSGGFFPDLVPPALAPLLQNSIAMGGFTAFLLSSAAHLMPKRGVSGVFKTNMAELPAMQMLLRDHRERLGMTQEEYGALSLCCEEIFCSMTDTCITDPERLLTLRVSRTEDGWFTEVICGHQMDDVNNFMVPDSFFKATAEELNQLGLILFSHFARDVKHIEISGYSYISFLI